MEDLFKVALGIEAPWFVDGIAFDADAKRLDITLDFKRGSRFRLDESDESSPSYTAYDTVKKSWRHLNFFEHECHLHARVPRVKTDEGRVVMVMPPWSGKLSGFTLLFEALLIGLCRHMPVHQVGKMTGVSDHRLWHLLEVYIMKARYGEDYSNVRVVGMDETSVARGHEYITLFVDLEKRKTLYITEGKDSTTVSRFAATLGDHGGSPQQITDVSCDMSPAFIKGIREALPKAQVTFDKFHILKIINEAVDTVRREEARTNPLLKGTRYVFLKNDSNLTKEQRKRKEELNMADLNLKSMEALRIRETFQQIYLRPASKSLPCD